MANFALHRCQTLISDRILSSLLRVHQGGPSAADCMLWPESQLGLLYTEALQQA